jgi:hypothetical protein
MLAVIVALVLLAAGVAVIYQILKNMSEDGVDIAAPGSCKRNGCGSSKCAPALEGDESPLLTEELGSQGKSTP